MRRLFIFALFCISISALSGCGQAEELPAPEDTASVPVPAATNETPLAEIDWPAVENWLFQLQRGNAKRIGETAFDIEDLYYGNPRDHQASPVEWTEEREAILRQWRSADKLVLTVDYTAKPDQIADAYRRSLENGFVPYVGDRSLGRLRINPGFEPSRSPAEYNYTNE